MNKISILIVVLVVAVAAFAAGFYFPLSEVNKTAKPQEILTLKAGIYDLAGYNSATAQEPNYKGKVKIEKTGAVFKLQWDIGGRQDQRGVGILAGPVLSVGYVDITGGDIQDSGVVSFRLVGEGKLEGEWSSILSNQTGREVLTLEPSPQ